MGVVVLLELVEPLDARIWRAGGDPVDVLSVRRVHAARPATDAPGIAGPLTFCALDTTAMVVDRWPSDGFGRGWYPPRLVGHICPVCDVAARAG
uniref:hypothetical protein n=1 Tax=Kitasatospora indigofera TaxID=67307 RepID=UPI002F9166EB